MYILMALIAPKFREFNSNTLSDIMAENYGQTARIVSALASFFYSTNAMEIMGMGFIFALLLKIPYWQAVLLAAVIVVVYTYTGGLWAVATTDMIQFFIMAVSLGIALLICWEDPRLCRVHAGLEAYLGRLHTSPLGAT